MKRPARRCLQGPAWTDALVRLDAANDNVAEHDERSVTVAAAAVRLGCNPTTVRELLRKNVLAGHRIGRSTTPTGVRIKLWSIKAFEQRHALGCMREEAFSSDQPTPRRRGRNKANEQAASRLKALGA